MMLNLLSAIKVSSPSPRSGAGEEREEAAGGDDNFRVVKQYSALHNKFASDELDYSN